MPEKYRRPHHHERVQTVERMYRAWQAEREALLVVRHFNAVQSAKSAVWYIRGKCCCQYLCRCNRICAYAYGRDSREAYVT